MAVVIGFGIATAVITPYILKHRRPTHARFKNKWHELDHQGWIPHVFFNPETSGQIAHVSATIVADDGTECRNVNLFGLVCEECGHVNANRILPLSYRGIEESIFVGEPNKKVQKSTFKFTWIGIDEYDVLHNKKTQKSDRN